MEVGQHLKDEFMEQFNKLFPEKIKFIDLEINRFGNLLEYETILGRFILNHINFLFINHSPQYTLSGLISCGLGISPST